MTNSKRIFVLFFCLLMLIPVASAAFMPPAVAPCNVYKSCNHPDGAFTDGAYQRVVSQPANAHHCEGSCIFFRYIVALSAAVKCMILLIMILIG